MQVMKRTMLAAGLALLAAMPAMAENWNDPQEPFAVFGDTYYVGTHGLSAVLITSPQGHILIDGGSPESAPMIARHIRQLGFKPEDIKFILNSHEHVDHAGGISALQKLSGAAVLASVQGEKVLRSGRPSKGDPQYGNLSSMTPVANTRAVADGEVVRLGPLAVTAHYTPGHTQGGISWTWRSRENGSDAAMVYADSLNAMAAKPFRYSDSKVYPTALADIKKSIATVAALDCDILISAHPGASGLWERLAKQPTAGNAAFIDRQACRDYAQAGTERLKKTLAQEAAAK
ncbi:MAG TPA: subclass B3 metallo-beta-lactamase [Duganella sp.]|uniref:subclass B3 metallo-beta-lactamase n=1 Tax=Duganella sp. TaxID=1904440 RepID=UPI002ED19676